MKRLVLAVLGASILVAVGASTAAVKLPGLATGDYPPTFPVKPSVVGGWTGNASGFLGGPSGKPNSDSPSFVVRFGKIRWTTWTQTEGRGVGVVWVKTCEPDCAAGRWKREAKSTSVHAYRPQNGRFTRLAFSYDAGSGRQLRTFRLRPANGDWV
jgi:hypothetical protein